MAVLSFGGINRSLFSTGKKTSLASKTIKNISNILFNKTSSKKNISKNILTFKNRRIENERRMQAQSELFASSQVRTPGGSRRLALSRVGGSFLSRIMEFGAFMTAGWILTNMPTWTAGANELSNRIQSLNSTFTGFVDNIWDMMADIGRISGALFENMKAFDLTDSSYRVRNSMSGLISTLDSMGDQIKEAFSVIIEPFMNVPPLGSKGDDGAYPDVPAAPSREPSGQPPAPSGGAVSGAYDIASRIGANKEQWDIYRNTLAQIESGGRYDIPGGSGEFYDGRYQMGAAAKTDAARILGIPDPGHSRNPNDPKRVAFRKNKELQEKMFAAYTLANHGYLSSNRTYQGKPTVEQKLQILGYAHNQGAGGAASWLRTGRVGRDGFGTAGTAYTDALARNFRGRVNPYPDQKIQESTSSRQPQSSQQQSPQRAISTPSTATVQAAPMIVTSGYGWRWGRQHMGIDLVPKSGKVEGTPVIIKKGGTVVYANIGSRNMGQILITHDDGTQSRYLHVNNFKVSARQKVNAGQTIASLAGMGEPGIGNATGPHLHFEYYRTTSSSYSDPASVYQNYVSLGGKVIGTPGTPLDPKQSERTPSTPLVPSSTPSTTPSPTTPQTPTRTIKPTITGRYGDIRESKRHGGTDLATDYGTPITAVADGKIIETNWEDGWGYFLVYREDKSGLYHLYGHMPKGSYKTSGQVKKGEVIGKVGSTGRSSGPHLHWEVGKSWNGTIGSKFDPLTIYSSSAPFTTFSQSSSPSTSLVPSSTPSTAQTPSEVQIESPETGYDLLSQILLNANLTANKQDIVLINDLQPAVTQMSGGSGGSSLSMRISESDIVNSFIKSKLLLDLNYL